ncbi:MAG: hypothetical protein ACJ8FA_05365 [Xanthobacteraceae bacterium]
MVAAYALALQVLLTGVALGHSIASGNASESSLFVVCHGDGTTDNEDLPGKPLAGSPCVFCTLAKASCAILPTGHGIAINHSTRISTAAVRTDGHILEFNSPTGQYQRGPPVSISVFG